MSLRKSVRWSEGVAVMQEPPSTDSNLVTLRDKLRKAFLNGIRGKNQPELTLQELVNSYETSFEESLIARNYGDQTLKGLVTKVCGDIFNMRFDRNRNKEMLSLKPYKEAGTPQPLATGEKSGKEAPSTEEFRPLKKPVQLAVGSATSFQQPLKPAILPQRVVGTDWGGASGRLVNSLSDMDLIAGRICLLEAPILNASFLKMLRISDEQWMKLYTLLRWYASGPNNDQEFIRLETLSALCGYYYGKSLVPMEFGVPNYRELVFELQEWVDWDLDNAGFMWVHLRAEPRQERKDTPYISKKYSDKSELKKKLVEEMDVSFALPPAPPGLPATSQLDAETRVNLYALLLCHFPLGMDTTELMTVYCLAFGKSLTIPDDLDVEELVWGLQDLFVVEKKSPLHSMIFVRLDIPVRGLHRDTLLRAGLDCYYDICQEKLEEKEKKRKAAGQVENRH